MTQTAFKGTKNLCAPGLVKKGTVTDFDRVKNSHCLVDLDGNTICWAALTLCFVFLMCGQLF